MKRFTIIERSISNGTVTGYNQTVTEEKLEGLMLPSAVRAAKELAVGEFTQNVELKNDLEFHVSILKRIE